MLLFESLLLLLGVAVILLHLARRLRVPYPAMLALAGGLVAALPGVPRIGIEPQLVLALFVAPAVMDTAFDMPPRELRRMWLPLTALAVVLVLLTAAAAAVLSEFKLPRRTLAVLQGESLLNDATALLIFGAAVTAAVSPGSAWSAALPRLLVAVPGGALLGTLLGAASVRLAHHWAGTLSS